MASQIAHKRGTIRALSALPGVARPADFGVGKWSRIATHGVKAQKLPSGWSETTFDDAKFAQWLRNFRLMFAARGRGMGSDYEHQVLNAALNGKPAPNLAYFTALAHVDQRGKLAGIEDIRGDATPIDPVAESARLRAEHPEADESIISPAGVWAYCSEVTPLGAELIPSYSNLSPLVNDDEHLEDGTPIGSALLNISFVSVSHQVGTNFALSRTHTMEITHDELAKKLSAHGLGEDPSAQDYSKALSAYMENTDDNKEVRSAMAKACAKAMSEGAADEPKKDEEDKHAESDIDGDEDDKKAQKKGLSGVTNAMAKRLAEAEKERVALAKKVAALESKQTEIEVSEVIADAKARGLSESEAREFYKSFGKAGALKWLGKFPRKVAAMGKWQVGGGEQAIEGSTFESHNGVKVIGRGLSKMAHSILAKGEAKDIGEAQRIAAKRSPHLYASE